MGGQPRRSRDEPAAARGAHAAGANGGPPSRVVIEDVSPQVDGGRFAAKRAVGQSVDVEATITAEGHDLLAARGRWRRAGDPAWHDVPMEALGNDRWAASFVVDTLARHEFTIEAWVDRFATWHRGFTRKVEAGLDVANELLEGAAMLRTAAAQADGADAAWLAARADLLAGAGAPAERKAAALDPQLARVMARHPDRRGAATLAHPLPIEVEVERAAFGAWYSASRARCLRTPRDRARCAIWRSGPGH